MGRRISSLPLDHPTGNTVARVPRRLGFQIIRPSVDEHSLADDRCVAIEREVVERLGIIRGTRVIGFQISQVAGVMAGIIRSSVRCARGIKVAAGGTAIRRRTIPLLVNMESV